MPLLALLKMLEKNVDVRNIGWSTCVDLQKAFNTVEHNILLPKPEHYGILGFVIGWFKSFLSDREKKCFNQRMLTLLSKYNYFWIP